MTPPSETALTSRGGAGSDRALIARVRDGDSEAFRAIVAQHSQAMYRVAYRMLGDPHEAEDVVQESFTRLWKDAQRWQPSGGGLGAWLRRVGVNLCLDRLRKTKRLAPSEPADRADDAVAADEALVAGEIGETIDACLAALPDRQRAALVLSYYEELSNAETAEILGLGVKAVESLLVRARRKMRKLLEREGVLAKDVERLS